MYVYVIQSLADDSQYVGMSSKPDERLKEHNSGRVKATKSKKPWRRIVLEEFPNRLEARQREKYLKSAAGRRFRKSLRAITRPYRSGTDRAGLSWLPTRPYDSDRSGRERLVNVQLYPCTFT
jgi:putative endonuclease